jgi:hypothetical protein
MLVAGVSCAAIVLGLGIWIIVIGPFIAYFIPLLQTYTPPYWWTQLGGDNIVWIIGFIWFMIVGCAVLTLVRMFHEASRTVSYDAEEYR